MIVYSFGFGVPVLLYFVMKFLGSESFSLPEVLICLTIVNLHLWVLFCLLFGNIFAVHNSLGLAALDFDGLRNDQLNSLFDSEHGRIPGHDRQERHVYSFRDYWVGPNYSFPHIQTGIFQSDL